VFCICGNLHLTLFYDIPQIILSNKEITCEVFHSLLLLETVSLRAEMADVSMREVLLVSCKVLKVKTWLIMGYFEETTLWSVVSGWNLHASYEKIYELPDILKHDLLVTVISQDVYIMWHVDPLLGNDRERSSYTKAVAKQQFRKQVCFHGNNYTAIMEGYFLCGPCRYVIGRAVSESSWVELVLWVTESVS
jgi:hypothetical protein